MFHDSVPWLSEKTIKCIEMSSKYIVQFVMTPKSIHKSLYPKKYSVIWKPPKNIEIQNFEPHPKIDRAYMYVCLEISEYPPPPPPPPWWTDWPKMKTHFFSILKLQISLFVS